jgi:PAS domain S-box-containing protein
LDQISKLNSSSTRLNTPGSDLSALRGNDPRVLSEWKWDIKNEEFCLSPPLIQFLGLEIFAKSALFDDFLDIIHINDQKFVHESLKIAATGTEIGTIECRIQVPKKRDLAVQISIDIHYSNAGKPDYVSGFIYDNSDHGTGLEVIELFSAVFGHSLLGISVCSPDGRIILANNVLHDIFGFKLGELQQLSWNDLVHPNDQPEYQILHTEINSGAVNQSSHNFRIVHKNGSILWANNAVSVYREQSGAIKFLVTVTRSIIDEVEKDAQATVSAALDNLPLSVILVDMDGYVRAMNSAARQLVSQNDGFFINSENKIIVESSSDRDFLLNLIHRVSTNSESDIDTSLGGALVLQRISMRKGYSVLVTPVRGGEKFDVGKRKPGAFVFITDPEQDHKPPTEVLCNLYGLTPAEARIAAEIVNGRNVSEISGIFGISQNTIKSQLKQIFSKTETQGQSDLIRLILRSPVFASNPNNFPDAE